MSALVRICSFIALCSLLTSLPRMADATGGHHQPAGEHKGKKSSLSGWVQSYKEPKPGEQQQQGGGQEEQKNEGGGQGEEEEEEELTCTVKVQKVEKHTGKCIRLRGGSMACQTSTYLDPVNADCMFLE